MAWGAKEKKSGRLGPQSKQGYGGLGNHSMQMGYILIDRINLYRSFPGWIDSEAIQVC